MVELGDGVAGVGAGQEQKQQQQQETEAAPETPRTPLPHASSVQQQQQSESEVVELAGAGGGGADYQHVCSGGAVLGVGIEGDFEGTTHTPNTCSSESMGEEPAVARSVSLLQGVFGRYGAPTYPFDPGKSGSLTLIR